MARYRTYSIEFKRQIVQEYLGGEDSLHGLSKRHGVGRNLIRIWLTKYQEGEFTDEAAVADSLEGYEARIAALERKVGQLTMENELLKKTLPRARSTNGGNCSLVSGPPVALGRKDVAP
jgi:transposase